MQPPQLILLAGPTASGKSARALELAREKHGTIINTDALQVYAGLPILSAQPSQGERAEVPHELYGVVDPAERSSAGKWLVLAQKAIADAVAAGRVPILVGGTGLYFRALLGGLADMPDIPESVREATQNLYDKIGEDKFRAALAKLDPVSASKLARNDRQRLIRAYEVVKHTSKPMGEWQKGTVTRDLENIEAHLFMPPREELYIACDRRFEKMMTQGAMDEVRIFLERGLNPILPSMKTIGVREIGAYFDGKISLDEAVTKAQQATRNYAKRQMTWFRNQWKF
jgi:tRNA dimethylallyltransferase